MIELMDKPASVCDLMGHNWDESKTPRCKACHISSASKIAIDDYILMKQRLAILNQDLLDLAGKFESARKALTFIADNACSAQDAQLIAKNILKIM